MEIIIKEIDLQEAGRKGAMPFLQVFIDTYNKLFVEDPTKETLASLNGYQNTLLAFGIFRNEVRSGGFVQLIHNGYGPYIFDNPFARAIREMGAGDLSKLIYAAKKIYDARKNELEQEVEEEELCETYLEFEEFDVLDDKYIDMEDEQTMAIAEFVDEHIDLFATIIK